MKNVFIFALLIFGIGCAGVSGGASKELYLVGMERETGGRLILPHGWEPFFVYGGYISAPVGIKINSQNSFECLPKEDITCKRLENKLAVLKEEGIVNTVRKPDLADEDSPADFTYVDGGDFGYYEKTELIPWEGSRFWDVFMEKYVLSADEHMGYRLVRPETGKKYVKSASLGENGKRELWEAVLWRPEDIVKEKNPDGSYTYKEGKGNAGYNPWRG